MKLITTTILLATMGALAGCESGAKPEPKMAPASRSVPEVEQAANELADAYCQRSQRCNEIGENAKYKNMDACKQAMLVETQQDLADCHGGLDRGDFNQCVATVKEEGCQDPLDALHQYKSCSGDDMCAD